MNITRQSFTTIRRGQRVTRVMFAVTYPNGTTRYVKTLAALDR